ncbi:MAG: heavy-metal-associated domain-containing protein [Chitinophagaceae bacterium]|nr:MAG: heavy-metal-associated domain-containing protein [Chitinophagaceae bacterium]
MTHTYNVSGMTCTGCQIKVQGLLSKVTGVENVSIDLQKGEATIAMNKHVPTSNLQAALKEYPSYQLAEPAQKFQPTPFLVEEETKSWLETYKPILIIFGYILGGTLLVEFSAGSFMWMRWMHHFMAAFFLVFSFFKLLNLSGFAESYAMYDIVAKRWKAWGYIYAFLELGLGIAFLTNFYPLAINAVTFVVMTVSIIGVLQSVLNKRKIKCACLGDVFNLPMSTITIIEDALMIAMSVIMFITLR